MKCDSITRMCLVGSIDRDAVTMHHPLPDSFQMISTIYAAICMLIPYMGLLATANSMSHGTCIPSGDF
jgi:hypothetical protein